MVSCSVSCVSKKKGKNSFISTLPLMSFVSAVVLIISDLMSNSGKFGSIVVDMMFPATIFIFCPSGTRSPTRKSLFFSFVTLFLAVLVAVARLMYGPSRLGGIDFTEYIPALLAFIMLAYLVVGEMTRSGGSPEIKALNLAIFFVLLLGSVYCSKPLDEIFLAVVSVMSVAFYLHLCAATFRPESGKSRKTSAITVESPVPVKAADRDDHFKEIYLRLQELFDTEKPYLDENITVGEIAKKLYTNKVYLSRVINEYTGKNFCQYVNYYRVMYSIQVFKENPSMRVSDLADISGFHTLVSYNMAFRLVMNDAPGEWCRRTRLELNPELNKRH